MKKHARENLRKRRNRHQKEQREAHARYLATKRAATVTTPLPTQPQVRREPLVVTLHADPLGELIDDIAHQFGLFGLIDITPAHDLSLSRSRPRISAPDVVEAEPGSFRTLVEELKKR